MLDRVKEAMFSSLGEVVTGARVLDLFAGSGSLGLEALSRGAACVRSIEKDRRATRTLAQNVGTLGVEESVSVVVGDALDPVSWSASDHGPFDLVFMDPPYPMVADRAGKRLLLEGLEALGDEALSEDAWIVLHTHPRDLSAEELGEGWEVERREYGNTALWYLQRAQRASS